MTRDTLPAMRVFITGGDGQLGRALRRLLPAGDVTACDRAALDVTDIRAVRTVLAEARPDVVINAAALTDTSLCEREPRLAHAVNALGAENVARGGQPARNPKTRRRGLAPAKPL